MRYTFFAVAILLVSSCRFNSKPLPEAQPVAEAEPVKFLPDSFTVASLISSVPAHANHEISYSLYLPKNYSDTVKFPAIFFFDPHADGSLPVSLYQKLADRFNYVLVGSNNCKNGMSLAQTNSIIASLMADAQSRLSLNEKNLTLCGFSGGAKVALYNAADNEYVKSVIYCGAAIELPATARNFDLIGFAGKRDMNYTDVIIFDQSQNTGTRRHCLIEHNGKHEWPDEKTFENAFLFLEPTNQNLKCFVLNQDIQRAIGLEQSSKQIYLQAFETRDLAWWKNEITSLTGKKNKELMCERLLGFISLACYSMAGNALQQNDLIQAEKILSIYALADPGNKDCAANLNVLKAKKQSN